MQDVPKTGYFATGRHCEDRADHYAAQTPCCVRQLREMEKHEYSECQNSGN